MSLWSWRLPKALRSPVSFLSAEIHLVSFLTNCLWAGRRGSRRRDWLELQQGPSRCQRRPHGSVQGRASGSGGGLDEEALSRSARSCNLRTHRDEIELWANQRRLSTSQVGLPGASRLKQPSRRRAAAEGFGESPAWLQEAPRGRAR